MIWRWFVARRERREKSVLAWRAIAQLPDEPALFHPAGHPLAGLSRRARVSRFVAPDRDKLRLRRRAPVIDHPMRWRHGRSPVSSMSEEAG